MSKMKELSIEKDEINTSYYRLPTEVLPEAILILTENVVYWHDKYAELLKQREDQLS